MSVVETDKREKKNRLAQRWLYTLISYVAVTKPPSVLLLVFTALVPMVVAAEGQSASLRLFLVAVVAITLGCAGANTLTCYIDRDIDALMERTRKRPIPAKRIYPPEKALYWGLLLTLLSLILAWTINFLSFVFMALGLLDNVVVYSLLTKRRSPLNIIWGGFSGGLPALFGWAAVSNEINFTALLIATLVVLWIPNHIWNLAIFYSDDYKKVKVPMLPAVFDLTRTLRCIAATVLLMYLASIGLYFVGKFGWLYLGVALVFGLLISMGNMYLFFKPSRRNAWLMFKLSSPYLFVLFAGMMADVWLR
jgi:protoheme IX farnesyltransferase